MKMRISVVVKANWLHEIQSTVSQELCKVAEAKPFMLNHPKLAFFKRLVEKLGGTHFNISSLLPKINIFIFERRDAPKT
jgi:hypothetical protein